MKTYTELLEEQVEIYKETLELIAKDLSGTPNVPQVLSNVQFVSAAMEIGSLGMKMVKKQEARR